jgi:hypothetical protein
VERQDLGRLDVDEGGVEGRRLGVAARRDPIRRWSLAGRAAS